MSFEERSPSQISEECVRLLADALRGRNPSFRSGSASEEEFLRAAAEHGVECMVRRALKQHGWWPRTSPRLTAALDARAIEECAKATVGTRELTAVLSAFRRSDIQVLVIKGAALAHTHYPAAYLRPRCDADLLIQRCDRARAVLKLTELNYERVNSLSRDAVHTQWTFERRLEANIRGYIDLHWEISNRPLFARMLSFGDLVRNAVRVEVLGEEALTPTPVHALLLACLHRVAHHDDSNRLIWLFDLKLLADSLSESEWEQFWDLVGQKQLVALCCAALELTSSQFDCAKSTLRAVTSCAGRPRAIEASAAYLGGETTPLRSLVLDFQAAKGFAGKARLIASHSFPDAAYMRDAHGISVPAALPIAYLKRIGKALWRLASKRQFATSKDEIET